MLCLYSPCEQACGYDAYKHFFPTFFSYNMMDCIFILCIGNAALMSYK